MKRVKTRIISIAVLLGLLTAFFDAFWVFCKGTFWELLVLDVPAHEIYFRILILLTFLAFGIVASTIILRLQKPFSLKDLEKKVGEALARKKSE